MDELIRRARLALIAMGEHEVAGFLMEVGFDAGDVFLAVKAAKMLEADVMEMLLVEGERLEAVATRQAEMRHDERNCR